MRTTACITGWCKRHLFGHSSLIDKVGNRDDHVVLVHCHADVGGRRDVEPRAAAPHKANHGHLRSHRCGCWTATVSDACQAMPSQVKSSRFQ
eukprot:363045-Chlamydomonas_euryale.AAC.7